MAASEPAELPVMGIVGHTLEFFEHAVTLARGAPGLRSKAQPTVPYADMAAAHDMALGVLENVRTWHQRAALTRWPTFTAFNAQMLVDAAASAARGFELETRLRLDKASPGPAVRSVDDGRTSVWVGAMNVAREPLEIIAGERPAADGLLSIASELTYQEIHDKLLFVPALGEVILALELVTGRSVLTWQRLSATERVLAGLGIVLAPVLGAAARAAARVPAITRRTVLLALAERGLFAQMPTAARRGVSLQMAIGLRILPEEVFQKLLGIVRRHRGVVATLTEAESLFVNRCLARVQYRSRQALWLGILKKRFGKLPAGFEETIAVEARVKFEQHESAAMKRLAELSGERVVPLPKVLPEYHGLPHPPEIKGVKYPDVLWGDELCEFRELMNVESTKNAISKIGEKGLQANTAVITLGAGAKTTLELIEEQIPRIWGKPERAYLDRIVLLGETGYKVFPRPDRYVVPLARSVTRAAVPRGEQLADLASQILAEPEHTSAPAR